MGALDNNGLAYLWSKIKAKFADINHTHTTVNGHTVNSDVPANAKFTDTNTWRGIQDNLTSDSATDSLSAKQGKALKTLVDGKQPIGNYMYSAEITGTIDDLYTKRKDTPGGGGSVNLTKKSSGVGSEIAGGWYNYIYSPHRTGSGGDNADYATILLMPMTFSGTSYIIRVTNKAVVEVKPISNIISNATQSAPGLMSASDKTNLDNLSAGGTVSPFISFLATKTVFNADGSITETDVGGNKMVTTFVSASQIRQVYTPVSGSAKTRTTVFNSDGSITETVT